MFAKVLRGKTLENRRKKNIKLHNLNIYAHFLHKIHIFLDKIFIYAIIFEYLFKSVYKIALMDKIELRLISEEIFYEKVFRNYYGECYGT